VGEPSTLAAVLKHRHFVLFEPQYLEERLQVARELVRVAADAGERETEVDGRGLLMASLLEIGDIRGVDEEIEAFARGAEELRQPNYLRFAAVRRAMRALLAGRLDEVERLLEQQSLQHRWYALDPNVVQASGVVLFQLRRHQGRVDEIVEAMETLAGQYPAIPAWRCALALLFSAQGREDDARRELERMAVDDFQAVREDPNRLVGYVMLGQVAVRVGDRDHAARIYDLLLPYEDRNVVVGNAWACEGSAASFLGELAGMLGRYEDAERHFTVALMMNRALGAVPNVAETQFRHAEMLAGRDGDGDAERAAELVSEALDTAQERSIPALVERAFALKLKLQGIDTADVRSSIDAVAEAVEDERPDLSNAAAPDGTVTILFSDIEGSTAMTERLGDRRWLEVLREHNRVVRDQVRDHEGFEVKSQGDGFMIAFSSARRALDCAISVQRAFAAQADERPDEAVRVRIGMHTGEAIREQDDFFGRNVILAARIAAQAEGQEILVSSLLKELTESSGDIAFGEAREVVLKGLTGTYRLHAVDWGAVAAGAAG
jgi:class 3 adenylate cyclase